MVLVLRAPHPYTHLLLKAFSKVLDYCYLHFPGEETGV